MKKYVLLVGLDEREAQEIRDLAPVPVVYDIILPSIKVQNGDLWAQPTGSSRYVAISKVVFHGIFEQDIDFIAGLALWRGEILPNARAMLDCRLKFSCLVRALEHTKYGDARGYASPFAYYNADGTEYVAKWGNWHCGENKERFTNLFNNENASIIEPYFAGEAVRIVIIGDKYWQIKLEGDDWLKSIHHDTATFMPVDRELLEDTRNLQQAFGLEIIANDYIVEPEGTKHLLEVNHIPNVTRFPEIWEAYRDFVLDWIAT